MLVPTAFWLGRTAVERSLLIGSCLLVLIVELLNTGIENVVDRVGQEHHRLSGQAKDLGSAAVFTSLVLTLLVWGLIAGGALARASADRLEPTSPRPRRAFWLEVHDHLRRDAAGLAAASGRLSRLTARSWPSSPRRVCTG